MFEALGYRVQRTPGLRDWGADLLLTRNGEVIAVQCKRWSNSVGNGAVQAVYAARSFYSADAAWLVTSSTYTAAALEQAKKCKVQLVNRDDLIKLFEQESRRWFD